MGLRLSVRPQSRLSRMPESGWYLPDEDDAHNAILFVYQYRNWHPREWPFVMSADTRRTRMVVSE